MKNILFLFVVLHLLSLSIAKGQINGPLPPIPSKEVSPVGEGDFVWGCVANFNLSDERNWGRIKFVSATKDNWIYVVDNNGFMYALHALTFEEKWKIKLRSQYVHKMEVAPDGKSIVVAYTYTKAFTKTIDIFDTEEGNLLRQLKRKTSCYEATYLSEVIEKTTLYPDDFCFSPDGSKLAVWYNNHGFSTLDCNAEELHEFVVYNAATSEVIASRHHIKDDFGRKKCNNTYPFVFTNDSQSILMTDCYGKILRYDANNFKILGIKSFEGELAVIIEEVLKGNFGKTEGFSALQMQGDGSILANVDGRKAGWLFRISKNLRELTYITTNQATEASHLSFSPNKAMIMCNADCINLWALDNQQPIFYDEAPKAVDANTVRFHPTKKAIIVGTNRTIKILAPCPISRVEIGRDYTPTGHFLNAGTTFSIRGNGKIYWAYGHLKIYKKFATQDAIATENLGFGRLFNRNNNIPHTIELKVKTNTPGKFLIFGGTKRAMTAPQTVQSLAEWE